MSFAEKLGKLSVLSRQPSTITEYTKDHEEDYEASQEAHDEKRGTGGWGTAFFNVVCVVAGTGTLGLPHAFAKGGWLGILILFLSWFMAVYSGIILIRCLYSTSGPRLVDIKQVGFAAFGWIGYIAAALLHILNVFGSPALYLVLASGNLHALLIDTKGALTQSYWVIIVGGFLLVPMIYFKTLKEVTVVAALGALSTAIAVFVVLIQGPMDHNAHPERAIHHDGVIWTGFPSALSTIAFSYGGNNTYPHVEMALANPKQWKWAVTAGLSTCTALYILTAIPGYWSYGNTAQSPIYNSLPEGAGKMVAMIVMTVHVIFAIPIYAVSFCIEFELFVKSDRFGKVGSWIVRAIVRTVTMVILCILAIYIPYFGDFMSLMGALANCGLVFLLPVLCYLRLTGIRNKPIYELAFCALTIFLGIIGCVFGTIDAIKALIKDFEQDS